jgi:glyoxylase-like metal-dependent hydrolase (beta-lactamase superfamily II)
MSGNDADTTLKFPFQDIPQPGQAVEIEDGVLWARIPLPYRLDHVNVYLVRDHDSWTLVDTGINTAEARAAWESLFAGAFRGLHISKVIVTHHHPDHIGLAGWICERFGAELLTSQTAYMSSRVLSLAPQETGLRHYFEFYVSQGMSEEVAGLVAIQGSEYLRRVSELPPTFLRLVQGDKIAIGERELRVISVDGHAPEQIMLYDEKGKLLFAADQVIERISPNVSVFANEPNGDPLGHFLRSLRLMRQELPGDVLVLSGHGRPFLGLHERCLDLERHHEERCQLIREACAVAPRSVADLVPVLFHRALDPHQMSFAFTEALAHINRLVRRNELRRTVENGRIFYVPQTAGAVRQL